MMIEPLRALPVPGQRDAHDRSGAALAFERALQQEEHPGGSAGDGQSGEQRQGGGDGSKGSDHQGAWAAELIELELSPRLMRVMHQSLMGSLGSGGGLSGPRLLEALLGDVADGVRAGKQVLGACWRLSLRIDPQLLAQTELQMHCRKGQLSVSMRTACGEAHQRLLDVLPALNDALKRHGFREQLAAVFLVSPSELA